MHDPVSRTTDAEHALQPARLRVAPGYAPRRYSIVPPAAPAPVLYAMPASDVVRPFRIGLESRVGFDSPRPQLRIVVRNDAPQPMSRVRPRLRIVARNDDIPTSPAQYRPALAPAGIPVS